jgi:hypothetical protein
MIVGEYTITADDGSDNTMNIFSIVWITNGFYF